MFGNSDDGTCDEQWTENGHDVVCQRDAVITVDGTNYCVEHAGEAPVSDN